jgi:hypothetical protein
MHNVAHSQEALAEMSMGELVTLYNQITGESVKKFRDKPTGVARVRAAVAGSENASEAPEGESEEDATDATDAEPQAKGGGRKSKHGNARLTVNCEANPHRQGTKSHATYEMIRSAPGITFQEAIDAGARRNTLNHDLRNGWMAYQE